MININSSYLLSSKAHSNMGGGEIPSASYFGLLEQWNLYAGRQPLKLMKHIPRGYSSVISPRRVTFSSFSTNDLYSTRLCPFNSFFFHPAALKSPNTSPIPAKHYCIHLAVWMFYHFSNTFTGQNALHAFSHSPFICSWLLIMRKAGRILNKSIFFLTSTIIR